MNICHSADAVGAEELTLIRHGARRLLQNRLSVKDWTALSRENQCLDTRPEQLNSKGSVRLYKEIGGQNLQEDRKTGFTGINPSCTNSEILFLVS
jgi:hypothetical protein